MDKLISVIGPAPSEIPPEEFLQRLKGERSRVAQALQEWRMELPKSKRKSLKSQTKEMSMSKFLTELKELGMTVDELNKFIKEGKAK
jgi:DNA-binding transcriptional regulator YhcF (GntR family)